MTERPLTKAEAGRLGGLQAAHNLGPAGRARRAAKGGEAFVEAYGRGAMVRLSLIRRGLLPATALFPEKPNAARTRGGARVNHQSRDRKGDTGMIPAQGEPHA